MVLGDCHHLMRDVIDVIQRKESAVYEIHNRQTRHRHVNEGESSKKTTARGGIDRTLLSSAKCNDTIPPYTPLQLRVSMRPRRFTADEKRGFILFLGRSVSK